MLTPLKWLASGMLVILLIVAIGWASSVQNVNTSSIAEINSLADTLSVGSVRTEIDDEGKVDAVAVFFDKEELIAHLTAKVVEVQKSHDYDIKLDYVFFDKDKKVTDREDDIRSVQFRVQYLDKQGEVKSNAERHLAVHLLN